jgi:hypothetical protein
MLGGDLCSIENIRFVYKFSIDHHQLCHEDVDRTNHQKWALVQWCCQDKVKNCY